MLSTKGTKETSRSSLSSPWTGGVKVAYRLIEDNDSVIREVHSQLWSWAGVASRRAALYDDPSEGKGIRQVKPSVLCVLQNSRVGSLV